VIIFCFWAILPGKFQPSAVHQEKGAQELYITILSRPLSLKFAIFFVKGEQHGPVESPGFSHVDGTEDDP
jgi:hypothetical protein